MLRHVSRLAILALVSAAVHAQTLDKVIPLGSAGSEVEYPWLVALDSTLNRLFVVGEDAYAVVAIDAVTHERVGCVVPGDYEECLAFFVLPGLDRVCAISMLMISFIEATSCSLVAQFDGEELSSDFFGGGCNPVNGKVYCAFDDSLMVFDGATGELRTRLEIGWADDYYEWMPFAASPASNKVYLYTYGEPGDWNGVVVLDGAGDSIVARLSLGPDGWVGAMCHDDRNDIVWCGVADSVSRILGIDCRTDSIVADVPFGEWSSTLAMTYDQLHDRVYCSTDEYKLVVVDAGERRLRSVESISGWITTMAVGRDGRKLYCADEDYEELLVYDLEWEQFVGEVEGLGWTVALCWNPLTDEVCCADNSRELVAFVDAERDSVVAETSTRAVPYSPVLDSANCRLYLVGPDPDVVSVVDIRDDTLVGEVDIGYEVTALCWCESSQRLFAAGWSEDSVAVIDPALMQVVGGLSLPRPWTLLSDGDRVYCCAWAGESLVVLAGDGSGVPGSIRLGIYANGFVLNPEARRLYVAGYSDEGLAVVDLSGDSILAMMPTGYGYHSQLAELPAEGLLYCHGDESLQVYDTRALRLRGGVGLGGEPGALCADPVNGRVFCGLGSELVCIDSRGDSVAGRFILADEVEVLGFDRNSGTLCWVGESLVGFVDARTLEERGTLPVSGLRSDLVCDEAGGRVFALTMNSVLAIRAPEPGPRLWSATGPSLVGRTIRLYGTKEAALHDVTGRRVMSLVPGENRLLGLAPGTYFLVQERRGRVQKVVLPR